MKQFFMMLIGGGALVAVVGFGVWLVLKALWTVFSDWRLQGELKQIAADSKERRERRRGEKQKRLDTGCEHVFDGVASGLPPNTCAKCGIEREKPSGMCDHVWKRQEGPTPLSRCEKCGRQYRPTATPQSFGA